ncbi:MAG: alpha/beta fold hydrolase [Thiotrichales bacterium]
MSKLKFQTLGSGPDIVMLHGWAMNSGVWGEFGDVLSRKYRLTLIDLPGHGVNADLKIDSVNDLLDELARITPSRAVWIGWSLGGMLAVQFAALYPARVSALLALSVNPKFVQSTDWRRAMPESEFDQFGSSLLTQPDETIRRFVALQCLGSGMSGAQVRTLQTKVLETRPSLDGMLSSLSWLAALDLRPALRSLEMPVLSMLGERDRLVPQAVSADWVALNSRIQVRLIAGAGHAPFLSSRAEVTSAAFEFLESHVART